MQVLAYDSLHDTDRVRVAPLARRLTLWLVLLSASVLLTWRAAAQDSVATSNTRLTIGAMAIGALTRVAPAYNGQTFTELQLTQPVFALGLARKSLSFVGMLNAEGYTLKRGELNTGIYGEGYVDRRHPHTFVHEAMLTWMPRAPDTANPNTSLALSISAGRGFVPFGSDDPMMRPFEKYPVNHHHAQILERIQAVAAARVSRGAQSATVELTTFNGDEPAGAFHGPRWNRFGDSWAIRGTVLPLRTLELSLSEASVVSPELQQGGAFDHRQRHASVRFDAPSVSRDARYVLAEWARTDEQIEGVTAFRYQSWLAEGAYGWREAVLSARIERTDRAEQRRLIDPFRTPLGHVEFQILGVTQWTVASVGLQSPPFRPRASFARFTPFLELSRALATPRSTPSAFEAAGFYGDDRIWSVTLGIRLHAGTMRSRMGRYGVMGVDQRKSTHHGM